MANGRNSPREDGVERVFISIPLAADLATEFLGRKTSVNLVYKWVEDPEIGNLGGGVVGKRMFPIYNYSQEGTGDRKNLRIMKHWFVKFLEQLKEKEFKPLAIEVRSRDEQRVVELALAQLRKEKKVK